MNRELSKREVWGIVALVVLLIATIVLAVVLGIMTYDRGKYRIGVENVYRHAYYSLMENYVDIETNLDKVRVIHGDNLLEEILSNITANASLASLSLSTLNTESNDLTSIYKFTNQVGDYARYLNRKVERGEPMTVGERSTLVKMRDISRKIGEALSGVEDRVNSDGYTFVEKLGKQDDVFSMTIRELNNGSIEYPALIYDGPFSDGIHDRAPKCLTGEEITSEQGATYLNSLFDEVTDITFSGENTNKFVSYLYDATMKDGSSASIQITKTGGHIMMFTSFVESDNAVVTLEEASVLASNFLDHLGYKDMTLVYSSDARGVFYLNFAPKVDGVIYYPDLIKLKISRSSGKVVGMEAMNYIYNHTERTFDKSTLKSEDEIISDIDSSLDIESVRLALIPKGVDKEILTYEIVGTLDEDKYYIYLDAVTGREVNVLMEIKSNGGNLLI